MCCTQKWAEIVPEKKWTVLEIELLTILNEFQRKQSEMIALDAPDEN